ncbi:sigma 54-interacting transcriptional regulator [Acetonema longum]|uniref:Transcriptional regulator n=1 Tax=Acetonema longum DSM 6540 TaxID=1009370 RepID=F7NEK2_9FIRM|nr:sigma 54-interacting transcriptional regulator [Acetonema longum]EGO65413.1 transcriptional regulator [Acetonema longum DSM 6540]
MSYLQQIQATAQQMAEAISSVLGMEVTIVDSQLERIAGTGLHQETVGQKITGKSIYQKVLRNGREYIVNDVTTFDDCHTCDRRAECKELAQLCCPIMVGADVIGVIGLIAFSRERQSELRNTNDRLLTFTRKMAELIAAKAVEEASRARLLLVKNQLETVLNFIAEGVLAIDHTAKIISINYAAEKMLGVKASQVIGLTLGEVLPGTPIPEALRSGVGFHDREVSVWLKGRHHHYLFNATPMRSEGAICGVVASFRSFYDWRESSSRLPKISFDQIVGDCPAMLVLKAEARRAAATVSTVLITGESGTGKEVFAKAIHSESNRGEQPFVAVNCAAIPENLLESELFGYEEGSFTGARKGGKPGKFQLADKGTIFLDEIGDMPLSLQAKILRVLQEKHVDRVGGLQPLPVNVRIIAATNRNLETMIQEGKFREDLYYRLSVYPLSLPPLRERQQDILLLARHCLQKHTRVYTSEVTGFSPAAIKLLQQYHWPGNIRELENVTECAVIRAAGQLIDIGDLPARITQPTPPALPAARAEPAEKQAITGLLETYGKSVEGKKQAAKALGIGVATLYRKIRKYQIEG